MGLDLSIRHQENVREENGKNVWTTIEVGSYRNVWDFCSALGVQNCLTENFMGSDLKEYIQDLDNEEEKEELSELLEVLDDEEPYEVHAWW